MKPTIEEAEASPVQFGDPRLPAAFWENATVGAVDSFGEECWVWRSPLHEVETVRSLVWDELSPHEPMRTEQVCRSNVCFSLGHMYAADQED